VLKGGRIEYEDESGHKVSVQEFQNALREWMPFIKSIQDWRSGLFVMTLTEWNALPPITRELIELHDKIAGEVKASNKK